MRTLFTIAILALCFVVAVLWFLAHTLAVCADAKREARDDCDDPETQRDTMLGR